MPQHVSEPTVVMDSNYWINFENHPSTSEEFKDSKTQNDFRVTYTLANFIDMANTGDQDVLSSIIADTADAYMAVDTYNGTEYYRDTDPVVLSPPDSRREFAQRTAGLDDEETLKHLFRNIDQAPNKESVRLAQEINDIYGEHGRSRAELAAFGARKQRDENTLYVDWEAVHDMEFIRKMLVVEHAAQIQPEEKVRTQDYVDMEVCAQCIFESDIVIVEGKWEEYGIIQRVCDRHPEVEPPVVVSTHEDLLDAINRESHS